MKFNVLYVFPILVSMSLVMYSCQKDASEDTRHYSVEEFRVLSESLDLPEAPADYSVGIPTHLFFGSTTNRINEGADDKATLGRVLFYDTRLSSTNTVSCATCHKQEFAFADDQPLSNGVKNLKTARNSLALAAAPNLSASYDSPASESAFGWDHANETSLDQSLAALLNSAEMGNTEIAEVVIRLNKDPIYTILTKKAFDSPILNGDHMLESLDAFMNSISSFDSKFDLAIKNNELFSAAGENSVFTDQESLGKFHYMAHCSSCHGLKQDIQQKQFANNGLDLNYTDKGVGHLQGYAYDGMFKVPFLRNIDMTAPYMHDGRFNTLEEVVDHYSENIKTHRNLSFELRDPDDGGEAKKINFSDPDKQALVAFLHTLTDEKLLTQEKYSDPFVY